MIKIEFVRGLDILIGQVMYHELKETALDWAKRATYYVVPLELRMSHPDNLQESQTFTRSELEVPYYLLGPYWTFRNVVGELQADKNLDVVVEKEAVFAARPEVLESGQDLTDELLSLLEKAGFPKHYGRGFRSVKLPYDWLK